MNQEKEFQADKKMAHEAERKMMAKQPDLPNLPLSFTIAAWANYQAQQKAGV